MNILTSLFGRLKRTQHDRDVIRERTVALALITTLEMQHLEAREAVRYSAQASAIGYQFELARQRLSPQEQEPFPSTRTLDPCGRGGESLLTEECATHRAAPFP